MNKDKIAELVERLRVHRVILKSGDYDGAQLMQAWCDMINAADALTTLSAENERLRAALRFYAREISWKSCGVYMSGQSQPSSAIIDKGNRARQALAGDTDNG